MSRQATKKRKAAAKIVLPTPRYGGTIHVQPQEPKREPNANAFKEGHELGERFLTGFASAIHADRIQGFLVGLRSNLEQRGRDNDAAIGASHG